MTKDKSALSDIVKKHSAEAGFMYCGISKAGFLEEEAPRLEQWLKQGKHGQMSYLERNFDKRLDPSRLVEGARSVISLVYNYFPSSHQQQVSNYKVSKYAYGKDYHFVIKRKLKGLMNTLQQSIGDFNARVFVDSAPVMERAWAAKSGTGWIGKNSLLLNRSMGSFFFLAEIISDLDLEPDGPIGDYCGTCTRCMDACPTDAIPEPYVVDGSKCISYLTIELKEEIPAEFAGKMDDWIFGCDICQDVCPWNRFASSHSEPEFDPPEEMLLLKKHDWDDLSRETFNRIFKDSPLKRPGYKGMIRNISFARLERNQTKNTS